MGTVVSLAIREAEATPASATTDAACGAAAHAAAPHSDPSAASPAVAAAAARAVAVLHHVDDMFSTWKPDSPMSRVRRGEIDLAAAPPELAAVLEICRAARDASGGWFDPWSMPGGVDPTGLVKGWAAELALGRVRTAPGVAGALINAGGDVAVCGAPAPGQPWRVGIRHPLAVDRLLTMVTLGGHDRAVATSGSYERGDHVLDPRSAAPAVGLLSATVVGPDLAFVDALATGLFASGGRALPRIAGLRGYSALLVERDGTTRATLGFPATELAAVRAA
jgi:thiamine biosynthesis lipoprotein